MSRRRSRREAGQSTVEFALILPLILALVLLLTQLGLVVYSHLAVSHSAREVARTLAVDATIDVDMALAESSLIDPQNLDTSISFRDASIPGRQLIVVTVSYDIPEVPFVFGLLSRNHRASATAAMLIEQ